MRPSRHRRLGLAPSGERTGPATPASPDRSSATSAQPGGPDVDRRRRAGHVDLLQRELRSDAPPGSRPGPARRDRPDHARAVAPAGRPRSAVASGPCAPVSSRDSSTRTGAAVVGRPASAPRRLTGEATLPPKAPPLAERASPARRRARTTTRRSRGRRAPPTTSGASTAQSPVRQRERRLDRGTVVRRPCTLPAAARASASVSPTDQPPRPSGTATSASSGAVSSAKPPSPSATSGPTRCGAAALDRGPPARRLEVARRGPARPRPDHRSRPRRSSASPCSGTGGRRAPDRPPPRPRRPWPAARRAAR